MKFTILFSVLFILVVLFCLGNSNNKENFDIKTNKPTGSSVLTNTISYKKTDPSSMNVPVIAGKWSKQGRGAAVSLEQDGIFITTGKDCPGCFGKGTGKFIDEKTINFNWEKLPSITAKGIITASSGIVDKIQWHGANGQPTEVWLRNEPIKPELTAPSGFNKTPGCCASGGTSLGGKNLGMLMNEDCAAACKKDPECAAYSMWNTVQPGLCTLFPKGFTGDTSSTVGIYCQSDTDCYVSSAPSLPTKPITGTGNYKNPLPMLASGAPTLWGKDFVYQYKPDQVTGDVLVNQPTDINSKDGQPKGSGDPVSILKSLQGKAVGGYKPLPSLPFGGIPSVESFIGGSRSKLNNGWCQGRTPPFTGGAYDF